MHCFLIQRSGKCAATFTFIGQWVNISMFTFYQNFQLYQYALFSQSLHSSFQTRFIIYYMVFTYVIYYIYVLFVINTQLEKSIPSRGIIHNITPIMQNVILICILSNFAELESLELQVYFDICLIHLLNNQVMMKLLCCPNK